MPKGIKRRQFLKIMGFGGAALAAGCSPELPDLIPYIRPPQGIIPGRSTFFATSCRECPAGCGLIVENRDGRVIKAEGNPLHPINSGRLCPRGQASLTGLYNPDRIPQPSLRQADGTRRPLPWPQALSQLTEHLQRLRQQGRQEKLVVLTPLLTGTLKHVIDRGLAQFGAPPQAHLMYEPLTYEALQAANNSVFTNPQLPTYRLEEADLLISLGADFLETWLSNVEYARRFAVFHQAGRERRNLYIHVGGRRSLTAANADQAMLVAPGREYLVGLGILKALAEEGLPAHWPAAQRDMLQTLLQPHTVRASAEGSGVSEEQLRTIARRFQKAARPLVLAGGNGQLVPNAYAAAVTANLLCAWKRESLSLLDFGHAQAIGAAAPAQAMKEFSGRLHAGDIDLLLIHDSNPVFSLPAAFEAAEGLQRVPTIVSFSSYQDETTPFAHLHLPAHTFLEAWGDYQPKRGIHNIMQPAMGPVFDTRPLGDLLIHSLFGPDDGQLPTFAEVLQKAWHAQRQADDRSLSFSAYWIDSLRRGGRWHQAEWPADSSPTSPPELSLALNPAIFPADPAAAAQAAGQTSIPDLYQAVVYPTIQFYDGRMANRPWIQELPDPITQLTWGGWVEMHPDDALRQGLARGDLVRIRSAHGSVDMPVMPIHSVAAGHLALPIGQGHTHCGRFGDGLPGNVFQLLSPDMDRHGTMPGIFTVRIERLPGHFALAATSGHFTDLGRDILEYEDFQQYKKKRDAGDKPHITAPLPQGYHPGEDFYRAHEHRQYRWAMVVDLDRCIGCGACVMACYAENNVACVGREQMLREREMSWIRVQRYFEADYQRLGWLVMMCQHCDSAPCESVCPVFAPHHSVEGLNNQVYNRCFGTRFCSQNDPYKVRRFNWYTWTRPTPLDMQLNPDVTVRQKGVMEKCSFCVQRIVAAKVRARNEGRKVRDGDFTTACAQTCPTGALVFGSLLDPHSRVSQLINDARAYQVLHHLNTKPAVIYLKRLTQEI